MKQFINYAKGKFPLLELKLDTIAIAICIFYVIIQLFLIGAFLGAPQYSDAGVYQELAIECYNNGEWYPTHIQVETSKFIFNPGYINFLIAQLYVFGTLKLCPFINLFLNVFLMFAIWKLTSYIVSKQVGYLSIILFCLLPSNYLSTVVTATELLDAVLVFTAILLIRKSYFSLLSSALFLVLAEYIRPSAILFFPSILLWFYIRRYDWKLVVTFATMMMVFHLSLTTVVTSCTASSQLSGSTGGINMIMGAHDDMTGRFEPIVFQEGKAGYLAEKLNAYQTDSCWRARATEWIKDHPLKWVSYIPHKLFYLWFQDNSWVGMINDDGHEPYRLFQSHVPVSKVVSIITMNIGYYIVCILCVIGIWIHRKKLLSIEGLMLVAPILLNCMMIVMIVGATRYHYISNPIIILLASMIVVGKDNLELFGSFEKRVR